MCIQYIIDIYIYNTKYKIKKKSKKEDPSIFVWGKFCFMLAQVFDSYKFTLKTFD